jgi:hypothetical protein
MKADSEIGSPDSVSVETIADEDVSSPGLVSVETIGDSDVSSADWRRAISHYPCRALCNLQSNKVWLTIHNPAFFANFDQAKSQRQSQSGC